MVSDPAFFQAYLSCLEGANQDTTAGLEQLHKYLQTTTVEDFLEYYDRGLKDPSQKRSWQSVSRLFKEGRLNLVSGERPPHVVVWHVGPDRTFQLEPLQAQRLLTRQHDELMRGLAPYRYDPTNGIASAGDWIFVR